MKSNKELIVQIRKNNKNKNRIFCEIVLTKQEAEVFYSLIYALHKNPTHKYKGLKQLLIVVSNLLTIRYNVNPGRITQIEEEVQAGIDYYPKSKIKKAIKQDEFNLIKILKNKN
ncbi:MAG: hypothetical protein IT215_00565 [Chitinophagaceae bacterium]|nr:hypothetical protein [Chitinophagaceae bacterium]